MPFEGEHAARLKPPGDFDDFRRSNNELGDGIDVIFGIKGTDENRTSEIASIRFKADRFTVAQAREWLTEHPEFKPILFEPAKDKITEQVELPRSPAGLTVPETFQKMQEMGRKWTKEEAGYVEPSPDVSRVCGACRFFLRDESSPMGTCQVVEGPIAWFGTSELYISAVDEAAAVFAAKTADEMMEGEYTEAVNDGPKPLSFSAIGLTEPSEVIEGCAASGLWKRVMREGFKESLRSNYTKDEYQIRFVPNGQTDPCTGEKNEGDGEWKGRPNSAQKH